MENRQSSARRSKQSARSSGGKGRRNELNKLRPLNQQQLENFDFPFENAVFEGGWNNVFTYCGAVRLLEEIGTWRRIRRLAGCGTGALVAALLSVGYNSYQLERFFQTDLRKTFQDHNKCCDTCCLGINLASSYGWNPGKQILRLTEQKLRESSRKDNVTFADIHRIFQKELCIVVTNLSRGELQYCHPKTTPNMPVSLAVRMSLTVPGLYKPVSYTNECGRSEMCAEGGILCNYPIHCFDGWWLSMKPDDSFLVKLASLNKFSSTADNKRFDEYNNRTLGFAVIDSYHIDPLLSMAALTGNQTNENQEKEPDSDLYRTRSKSIEESSALVQQYVEFTVSANKFLHVLKEQLSEEKVITRDSIHNLIQKNLLSTDELKTLFGPTGYDANEVFNAIGGKNKNEVLLDDCQMYLEKRRLTLQNQYMQPQRRHIRNLAEYLETLDEIMCMNSRRLTLKNRDVIRTVPLNTSYIRPTDTWSALDQKDKAFLIDQGRRATHNYLENFALKTLPYPKGDQDMGFCRDDLSEFMDDDLSEIIDERDYMENFFSNKILS